MTFDFVKGERAFTLILDELPVLMVPFHSDGKGMLDEDEALIVLNRVKMALADSFRREKDEGEFAAWISDVKDLMRMEDRHGTEARERRAPEGDDDADSGDDAEGDSGGPDGEGDEDVREDRRADRHGFRWKRSNR